MATTRKIDRARDPVVPELTVLCVDDNQDALFLQKTLLETHGFGVLTAATAADALASVGDCRVDAVVLDLGLPDMPGEALLRRLRSRPGGQETTIIGLSGRAKSRDEYRRLGFDHYLEKPAETTVLVDLLRHVRPA